MGHSRFLLLLLLSSLLFLSFDCGFGRVALVETQEDEDVETVPLKEINLHFGRVMKYEIADYSDPQPNTNPKNGYILGPPSSPAPTHPPSP